MVHDAFQHRHPRRGQLDCQRHSLQPLDDFQDRPGDVSGEDEIRPPAARPVDKEGHRWDLGHLRQWRPLRSRVGQRRHQPDDFAGDLQGFAIAGDDHKFIWAHAAIENNMVVIVSSPDVTHPVAVRYGWDINPVCNLYSQAGLPAVPFRTDDWPMVTRDKK